MVDNYFLSRNYFSSDYCNISYDLSTLSVGSIVVDFRFFDRIPTNPLRYVTYPRLLLGHYGGVWFTPKGRYDLPMAVNNATAGLLVNFTYSEVDYNTSTQKAACVTILMRNDYNPATDVFSNLSAFPSVQVELCPWWSPNLPLLPQQVANFTDGTSIFSIGLEAAYDWFNTTSWPSYCIVYNTNQLNSTGLNVMPFLRYIS